ncbi:MAG: hypothetical protein QXQ94_08255 [Candidatus Bathyarchaeia archaeon]
MLEYKGYGECVNSQPEGEWIKIWVQNTLKWNREDDIFLTATKYWDGDMWCRTAVQRDDEWSFCAYISLDNYEKDIEEIKDLISRIKQSDDEIYVCVFRWSDGMWEFREWLHLLSWSPTCTNFTAALDPEVWREWFSSHQIKKKPDPEIQKLLARNPIFYNA